MGGPGPGPARGSDLTAEPRLGRVPPTDSLTGRVRVPDQPRDARHPGAGVGALAPLRRRCSPRSSRPPATGELDPAAARGHRGLQPGRRGHRRREQGDVRVHRQGRPARRPAARADGQRVPGVRPAPADHAVEGVVRRPELPLREAPARPLPPVRPGRHRGARRRRPVPRRRGHRPRLATSTAASDCARSTLLLNSLGEPADRARYVEALRALLRRDAGDALADAEPGDARPQPAARARLQARAGRRRSSPPRRRSPTSTATASAAHFDAVHGRPRRASASRTTSTRDSCAASTTTCARRSSSQGGTLDSAQNALGGGGRYDGLVEALGGPPTPGIGFALGVDRTLLACDDEGVFAAPRRSRRRVRRRHDRRPARRTRLTAELRAAGLAADRAFDSRIMKSQMKAADRSGAASPSSSATTSSPPAPSSSNRCEQTTSRSRSSATN